MGILSTPIEILNHMSGLLLLVKAYLLSEKFEKPQILNWDEEINRFHNMLKEIDDLLTHIGHPFLAVDNAGKPLHFSEDGL